MGIGDGVCEGMRSVSLASSASSIALANLLSTDAASSSSSSLIPGGLEGLAIVRMTWSNE